MSELELVPCMLLLFLTDLQFAECFKVFYRNALCSLIFAMLLFGI